MRELIGASTSDNQFLRSDLDQLGFNPRTRDTLERLPQDRDTLVQSINQNITDLNEVELQPLLTFDVPTDPTDPILANTRQLKGSNNVSFVVGAADAVLDLTDKLSAGNVGDASHLVVLAFDEKGRLTSASQVDLNSDNVTEGVVHLFFTQARARASVSAGSGITYNGGTGVFTLDQAVSRGLLSGGSGINYNSGTGAIALQAVAGVAGTHLSPTSITVNGFGQITAITP